MPYLVGLFGMYCFGPNRPRNPTMVSSTARLRLGEKLFLKLAMRSSKTIFTLSIRFSGSQWLTWSIQKICSNRSRENIRPKNGIALSQFMLQYDVMSGTWMTPMSITTARKPSISLIDTGFHLAKRDRGVSLFWSRRCSILSAAYLWDWCSLFTLKLVPRS